MNDIIVMTCRLKDAPVSFGMWHSILLPADSHLTALIVSKFHVCCGHGDANHLFFELRQKFWIQRGSSTIRSVINDCLICRQKAKRLTQKMTDLPPARLQIFEPAFSRTGVDFCGSFIVKQGRSRIKRYFCVFSCMTTRALHMEIAADLTTDSFLNVLRRFVARKRSLKHLYSDSATNFVGAEKLLQNEPTKCNQHCIGEHLHQNGIEWSINPPASSPFGGIWERMIRSIREVLNVLQPGPVYSEDVFHTVLTEVEAIINSRPLTPDTFLEVEDRPLTPNDLMMPDAIATSSLPPSDDRD